MRLGRLGEVSNTDAASDAVAGVHLDGARDGDSGLLLLRW